MYYIHLSCACGDFFPLAHQVSFSVFTECEMDRRKCAKRAPLLGMKAALHGRYCKKGVVWKCVDTDDPK